MLWTNFNSFSESKYQEPSLCSHDYDLHSPLLRPYKAENNDRVKLP